MRHPAKFRTARLVASASLLLLSAVLPLSAQVPADNVFRDFERVGGFIFELGGQDLDKAEIYLSERAAAYLVLAPELSSPVLISPRTQSVEAVHLMKVQKQPDGRINLLSDATFDRLSTLSIEGMEVLFSVKGQPAKLKPRPPLLGFQNADAIKSYDPKYARLADAYSPSAAQLAALRSVDHEVEILIYFGSWCPTCGRLVPRVLRVADELRGAKLDFQYYGLPRQIQSDEAAEEAKIHGVPTGIVLAGGKEIGRLEAADLNNPEASLARLLNGR